MPMKREGVKWGGAKREGVKWGGAKREGVLLFSGVPAPPAPERPGNVGQPTLTVINDSEIRVNWDAPTSPGTPITFYRIRYNDGSGNTLTPQIPADQTQYTLTGLDASTEYSIQVRAWNMEGRSPSWSTPSLATTDAPASTVPHTPVAPTLAAQSTSEIRAEWVAPNDGGETISSYSIRWHIGTGAYTEQVGLTALAYDIVGLNEDTEYSVSVRAVNSVGSSAWSAEAMESTDAGPGTLYLVDDTTDYLRAFALDGTREAASDIALMSRTWTGLAATADRLFALDTTLDVLWAYDHDGGRQLDDDINITPWGGAGVTATVDRLFVLDDGSNVLRAYDHGGGRQSSDDISLGGGTWRGVTATANRLFVVAADGTVLQAYDHAGARQSADDITVGAGGWQGLAATADRIYAIDGPNDALLAWDHGGGRQSSDDIDLGTGVWQGVAYVPA